MSQEQRVFSAIADPTRRQIVTVLAGQPIAVHDLAKRFSISRPAISKHLKVLKEAELVTERKEGRNRIYSTNPDPLRDVQRWVASFWSGRLIALKTLVEE